MRPTPRHDLDAAPWAPRRRPGLAAVVLLGHLCLLVGWHFELLPRLRGPQAQVQQRPLVWLNLAAAPRPVLAQPARPAIRPTTTVPAPRPVTPPPAAVAVADLAPSPNPAPVADAIHVPPPDTPASAASAPRQRLLDTAATRTAILQSTRTPLWAERTASAIDQPFVSRAEKQAEAVAKSAKGDCLKGEFGGAGMGLLSLPFFVVAEVQGHCAR